MTVDHVPNKYESLFFRGPLRRSEFENDEEQNMADLAYTSALRGWLLSVMVDEVARFRQESLEDRLTKLLNREGLAEAYSKIQSRNWGGCALFIDLDGFKGVNDGPGGHLLGDYTLLGVAGILKSIRQEDPVARFGGDEFVVLMEGASEKVGMTRGNVICDLINAISSVNGESVNIGASVGVVAFEHDTPWEDVYVRGDAALYRAKDEGGNRVAISMDYL